MNPITPAQAKAQKRQVIPDYVIDAFNSCILENLQSDGSAKVPQEKVIEKILSLSSEETCRQTIFDNHWLDIELCFSVAGWRVEYDKPGYNETYDATFTFTPK
jgi:hypothetical protein